MKRHAQLEEIIDLSTLFEYTDLNIGIFIGLIPSVINQITENTEWNLVRLLFCQAQAVLKVERPSILFYFKTPSNLCLMLWLKLSVGGYSHKVNKGVTQAHSLQANHNTI
jgi:hypothetical protein